MLSRAQAIDQIQSQSIGRTEGSVAYDATPIARPRRHASPGTRCYDPESEELFLGTTDGLELLDETPELQVLTTTGRTFVVSVGDLEGVRPGDVRTLPGLLRPIRSPTSCRARPRGPRSASRAGRPFESRSTRVYDPETDTITDTETGTVYAEERGPVRVAPTATRLLPGFTASVGFSNYREVLTGTEFRGDFLACCCGRSPSPCCRCSVSFAVGLGLAMTFNDRRMRGRKIYRSLLIIPYALPGFMMALVFRGMLNRTFGINRWLGIDVGWLETPALAMFSLVSVNVWLGYPYMFLVVDRRPAERPDRPQGGGVRRRGDRLDDVPQDHAAAAADRRQPAADRQLRLQLQQLRDRLPADQRRPAVERRERRRHRPADHVDVPHRPRRRTEAPGPRRRPVGADLHHRGDVLSAIGFKYTKTYEEIR